MGRSLPANTLHTINMGLVDAISLSTLIIYTIDFVKIIERFSVNLFPYSPIVLQLCSQCTSTCPGYRNGYLNKHQNTGTVKDTLQMR